MRLKTYEQRPLSFHLAIAALVLLLVGAFAVTPVNAMPPDTITIVEQMKEAFEPSRPSLRKMVITVSSDKGQDKARWTAGVARKHLADGKRNLIVILEPDPMSRNALLLQEHGNQEDTKWLFSPAIQRVRGIVPADAYEHFLRTDFTYSDLGFVSRRGQYRFLGEEEHKGTRAYKIEEVPKEQWYYSRILTWVAIDSLLPLQRDYYDRAGRLWKSEDFEQVAVIDGIPTPLHIRMHDLQADSTTELQMSEVRYDVDLPDALFDPVQLRAAVTSPLWEPYRAYTQRAPTTQPPASESQRTGTHAGREG